LVGVAGAKMQHVVTARFDFAASMERAMLQLVLCLLKITVKVVCCLYGFPIFPLLVLNLEKKLTGPFLASFPNRKRSKERPQLTWKRAGTGSPMVLQPQKFKIKFIVPQGQNVQKRAGRWCTF
jgi:hypothetical protein